MSLFNRAFWNNNPFQATLLAAFAKISFAWPAIIIILMTADIRDKIYRSEHDALNQEDNRRTSAITWAK